MNLYKIGIPGSSQGEILSRGAGDSRGPDGGGPPTGLYIYDVLVDNPVVGHNGHRARNREISPFPPFRVPIVGVIVVVAVGWLAGWQAGR